jgi:hypothetical protein
MTLGIRYFSVCDLLAGRAPDEGNFFLFPDEERAISPRGSGRLFEDLEHLNRFTRPDLSRGLKLDSVSRANPPADPLLAVDVFHP